MRYSLIVVGASLGGLHAVRDVLAAIPERFSVPIAIAQHREANVKGDTLITLLQKSCALPVSQIVDKQVIMPGRVFVCPSDYHVRVEEEHFALSLDEPLRFARPSIDVLFESAAEYCGEHTVGVMLTGASEDGARGLALIQDSGGLALVQDPRTAAAPTMPEAALRATVGARVMSPRQIGSFLATLGWTLNGQSVPRGGRAVGGRAREVAVVTGSRAEPAGGNPWRPADSSDLSILAVDDRPENLMALRVILEPLGAQVLYAESGEAALEIARGQDISIVLLDVQMPGMDGFETAARLRELQRGYEIPILFVTASEMEDRQIERGYSLGAVDYVMKPIASEALRSKVAAYGRLFARTRNLQARLWDIVADEDVNILVTNDYVAGLLSHGANLAAPGKTVHVITAHTGREASRLLLKLSFALIVLDVRLPDMEGLEVAEALRYHERSRSVPLMFVAEATGTAAADAARCYRVGAVDVLFTPIKAALFRGKVKALLGQFWEQRVLALHMDEITRLNAGLHAAKRDLERANLGLEGKVTERTLELAEKNVALLREIEERERAQAEREAIREQLLQAQKMETLGQVTGSVAHDFKNFLSVIRGNAELALDDLDPSHPICQELREILRVTEVSADLTRQLLTFARKQPVAPEVIDVNERISEMLPTLRHMIGSRIRLSWIPGPGVWPVRVDPVQVHQVVANLCINARDAITGPGGAIVLKTETALVERRRMADALEAEPGKYVRISVSDNGCGMDEETREKIFEPFFTTKEPGTGTGMGLSTVFGILKQNHGFVVVISEPGIGSVFETYFPRHRATDSPTSAAS